MKNSYKSIFAVILTIGFLSCNNKQTNHCNESFDPETWDSCNSTSFVYDDFKINILDYDKLPYILHSKSVSARKNYDADSVPLFEYQNRIIYHPVYIAQYTLELLDVYNERPDSLNLLHIKKNADKLVSSALHIDSAIYFLYTFDFPLHGCAEETMKPPWSSAMAQGQILSIFCRLFEITKNEIYLEISHKIFNSFIRYKGNGYNPWISCIDKNGNLWLEEFPRDLPCFTLNGMNFAIFGVYDYYRITKDDIALKILKGAITTIKANINRYRKENDVSWYCLKHHNHGGQSLSYHKIHIEQLMMLYKITGDSFFKEMSLKLKSDTKDKTF